VIINVKFGLINLKFEWVLQLIYSVIPEWTNNFAIVVLDNKFGICSTNGEIVCEPKFSYLKI
jgi:hypothetical protein